MLPTLRCGRSGCHRAVEDGNGSRRFKYKLHCYGLDTDSEIILTITKIVSLVRSVFCRPGRVFPHNQPLFTVKHIDGSVWKEKQIRLQEKVTYDEQYAPNFLLCSCLTKIQTFWHSWNRFPFHPFLTILPTKQKVHEFMLKTEFISSTFFSPSNKPLRKAHVSDS
jgi:hypothetical protein